MMVLRSTVSSRLASPLHLAHTHSHLPVSLDTTLLRSNLHPFAIYSIVVLSTTFPFIPTPNSYFLPLNFASEGMIFALESRAKIMPSALLPMHPLTPPSLATLRWTRLGTAFPPMQKLSHPSEVGGKNHRVLLCTTPHTPSAPLCL